MANFWDYPTNYSNGTGVDSVSDFFLGYPSSISSGLSSNTLIIFVFMVFFSLALPFGMGAAMTAASFITFILSTFLWWNGAIGMIYPISLLSLTIISAILVGNTRN